MTNLDWVHSFSRYTLRAMRSKCAEESCWSVLFFLWKCRHAGTWMKGLFMRNLMWNHWNDSSSSIWLMLWFALKELKCFNLSDGVNDSYSFLSHPFIISMFPTFDRHDLVSMGRVLVDGSLPNLKWTIWDLRKLIWIPKKLLNFWSDFAGPLEL